MFLGLAWAFWPTGPTFFQHWFGVGLVGFCGLLSIIGGVRKSLDKLAIKRDRAQAMIPTGIHGSAAFATLDDCQEANMTNAKGLFLGLLDGAPIFHNGKGHLLTVAPARQGKGISVVVPNLLHYQGSVFVTDPKGELAYMTAEHREKMLGHTVYIINPWGLHGLPKTSYNPLQILLDDVRDPTRQKEVMEDAQAIALQLLPEPEDPKNQFFRQGARKILLALMLHFATREKPDLCTLVELWRTVQNMSRLEKAIEEMTISDALGGTIVDLSDDLIHTMTTNKGQFADFREGASQAISIFDPVGYLGDSLDKSDFRFEDLKREKTTVYLVIPQERIETHGKWLGLLARQAITSITRVRSNTPVLFLLDEFSNMGKLAGLGESLTGLPGLGVRVWIIVQELAELRRVYGQETSMTVLSQSEAQQFFAVQSNDLAKELSDSLGVQTVKTISYNFGNQEDQEITPTVSEAGQPLLSANEIRLLPPQKQIILYRNAPPILCDRVPYWEVEPWRHWAKPNPLDGAPPVGPIRLNLRYRQKT